MIIRKILPSEKALYLTKIDCKLEEDTITQQNQVIETKTKMSDLKITRVQVPENSPMQVQHQMVNTYFTIQKEVLVTSNSEQVRLIRIAYFDHARSFIRKLFTKNISNVPLAGRLAYFIAACEKNTQDQENIIYCKIVRNPVCKSPISGENTKLDKNVNRTIFISGTGSFKNVGERSYPKSSTHTRAISEQPPPCRKKEWRERSSNKFKKSQQIHSSRAFQNGKSTLSKIVSRTGRFTMQDRSQGGIFFNPPQH